ncbi:hypothetical protein [Xanthomonas sp. GW]|uniref:hypothetical protein n=1 Tax=Xanthomonas sp. GW TaxID=2724121 RepID=UPI00163AE104|nr:hypothetical protein [Xanthomonas sp. GW]
MGAVHAVAAQAPVQYWVLVLTLYALSVLIAGWGVAAFALCVRGAPADTTRSIR